MKRTVLLGAIVLGLAGVGALIWLRPHASTARPSGGLENLKEPEDKAKAPGDDSSGARVSRDAKGNAVVTLSESALRNLGLQLTNAAPMQMSPEVKGYGRVLDPGPLAVLVTDLASAHAAQAASSNELARLKTLEGQGNASARAVQAAEATAVRDRLALQAVRDRLALSWGKTVAGQGDLPGFVESLVSLEAVLVRIDLPLGHDLKSPTGAQLLAPSGQTLETEFLGPAPAVDPEMQGRGFLLRVRPNTLRLAPGEAVAGYLRVPGAPLDGVVIPRDAVVRTEGTGWVYVAAEGGRAFVRTEVALDRPTEGGWFVTEGVKAGDRLVVTGAQDLLSAELKGGGEE